jgi:DNA invertase Pin-like site-specific DNA recombinase
MDQKRIIKIDALPKLQKKTRVAAYARVSTGKDAMLHSLAAQVSYYNKMISEHEGWEFAGVYADEALTGTKDSREEFQRLISDCKAGKIDMVVVKSISRFARNTFTMLKTVRELKALGIDVFFEEQNLHTLTAEGEMVLTFLASFAQEEARSNSENIKWKIKKDFEKGLLWGGKDMYGYKIVNRKLVLIPEQAELVKRVFKMYLDGCGVQMIANILNNEGERALKGGRWNKSTILNMITNYNYTGALVLQKTYREDYLSKKTKRNKGEKDMYVIDDDHDPIISLEDFQMAQELRKQRSELSNNTGHRPTRNRYTSLIRCGVCGAKFDRCNRSKGKRWLCRTYDSIGKHACASKAIPEEILNEVTSQVLGVDELTDGLVQNSIDYIEAFNENKIVYHFKDGRIHEAFWKDRSRRESWTPEMKEMARQRALKQHRKEDN